MPQLHFYVSEDVAAQVKRRAAQAHQPVSRYLAELVKRDVGGGWPEGYFASISAAKVDAPIPYEPSQPPEERLPLE